MATPQTFTDVGRTIDTVRDLARQCPLDLGKVITVGHSAGGHLGVWAAARSQLPPGHLLRGADPLPLFAVVALGIRQVLIHGTADTLVPLAGSQQYQQQALAAGDRDVQLQTIPQGDHFTLITPSSPQWPQVLAWIVALVR